MRYLIPAIDIRNNKVVRLTQGRFDQETTYADNPASLAKQFVEAGAERIHVVDLDGARLGRPQVLESIKKLVAVPGAAYEVGGGVRDPKTIETYLKLGVARVVCGSKACLDKNFLKEILGAFGSKVIIGIDAKDGRVATDGWTKLSSTRTEEMIERVLSLGGAEIIYTDIAKDGMLQGPNVATIEALLKLGPLKLIASGGISVWEDIARLVALNSKQLLGVIVGKAIYEGKLDLKACIERLKQRSS